MSLRDLTENPDLTFVFVGGKGGVGKTTTSSSLAVQFARARKDTQPVLLISTDPAHNLSDAFGQQFGAQPTRVEGLTDCELWVMEIDPKAVLDEELKDIGGAVDEAAAAGAAAAAPSLNSQLSSTIDEFRTWLTSVPGIDEAMALASVVKIIDSKRFSAVTVDTAPTGHTLRLLQLPSILLSGLERLEKAKSKFSGLLSMVQMFFAPQQSAQEAALVQRMEEKLNYYRNNINRVIEILADQKRTSFVTVCIAEALSVNETERLQVQLQANKISATHIVVNQLVPALITPEEFAAVEAEIRAKTAVPEETLARIRDSCVLTSARAGIQAKYLAQLRSLFPSHKIVEMALRPTEVTGVEQLRSFGESLCRL